MLQPAVSAVRLALGALAPEIGIVLGSGAGHLTSQLSAPVSLAYRNIPGFPAPTVEGHAGALVAGSLAGREVLMQSGRFHMYEGHGADLAVLPVRVMAMLGVRTLIVTNAAGGIRSSLGAGTLMLISDHLNLTGRSPLTGPVVAGETRFPDMTEAYDSGLRRAAQRVAAELDIALAEGVYAGLLGPSYETPAEIRMLEALGADAVGMSTVLEVIAARARGMRCLGISLITNPAAGMTGEALSHEDVMRTAEHVKEELAALVAGVVAALPLSED